MERLKTEICMLLEKPGSVCAHYYYWCVFPGEPSPPKLEGAIQSKGNVLKVRWIKQDDGGSPITHYLIRYKAVSIQLRI